MSAIRLAVIVAVCAASGTLAAEPKPAVPTAALACESPNDCSVYPSNCCPGCEATGAVSYNVDWVEEHGQPGCATRPCERCQEPLALRVFASCERKRCVVKRVDELGVTACKADADCAPWIPACCACNWDGAVAVRKDAVERLRSMACAAGTGCGRCAMSGPPPAMACRKKRCELAEPAKRSRGVGP